MMGFSRAVAFLGLALVNLTCATSVSFSDCTLASLNSSNSPTLQWITYKVDAVFTPQSPYNLSITVYGNITGSFQGQSLPPSLNDSKYWEDTNKTAGKIIDIGPGTNELTTLFASWSVASNQEQLQPHQDFCNVSTGCPLTPSLPGSAIDKWPSFNLSENMESSYMFSTINANFYVVAGDPSATHILCVNVDVTPYIGDTPASLVRYLPVLVLVLVAVATASAVFSPWGTWNIYHWTSNYGRDADQLRLITPGFGDCLGYIQFAVLSSSLALNYPGFFQPVISRVAWSTLMFNQSFVSHDPGLDPVLHGVYSLSRNTTSQLDNMSTMRQLVGMGANYDIWAGFMVWLLVIIGVLVFLIQLGTLLRILFLFATRTQEEDLRRKNWPFTIGNVIRVVFNYFFLPLVTFCIYQMYLAATLSDDPTYLVALATVTLIILLCFAGWLLYQILSTNPKAILFDNLPTVMLYGPLYNTYSDDAAAFALIPILVNVLRGIAIGGLQMSGIAQIIVLAIAEMIMILTLNAFRPFSSPTSMNLFHTAFSVVRIIVVLLMIAFVPGLQASAGIRTIIGYTIFVLHGVTLAVGFFLHSLQSLVEVAARALGAGGEGADATRGGLVRVFGVRQLSRRNPRGSRRARESLGSQAAMLNQDPEQDGKLSRQDGMRSRSMSASSNFLLNSRAAGSGRQSLALDTFSHSGPVERTASSQGHTTGTPSGANSILSYTPAQSQAGFDRRSGIGMGGALVGAAAASRAADADPYFRPPRQRRATNEALSSPGNQSRGSGHSSDWPKRLSAQGSEDVDSFNDDHLRESAGTPSPAYLGYTRAREDAAHEDPNMPKPDYATREVDYYYGVRGPALNEAPTRKLKTGPADPTGPVSSATGWFKNIFGGKSKDKHKGFEVVRGRGVKQGGMEPPPAEDAEIPTEEPYTDEPSGVVAATTAPRKLDLEDEADAIGAGTRRIPGEEDKGIDGLGIRKPDPEAPVLPEIDAGESIHMPSRVGSKASRVAGNSVRYGSEDRPPLPRHGSRSSALRPAPSVDARSSGRPQLDTINQSPAGSPEQAQRTRRQTSALRNQSPTRNTSRMPFGSLGSDSEATASTAVRGLSTRHERQISEISEGLPSPIQDPNARRGSIGYVSQHRASENIVNPPMILGGSTAELVDDSSVAGTDRSPRATPEVRGAPHINF